MTTSPKQIPSHSAKRGDLVLIRSVRSSTFAFCSSGGTQRKESWSFALVTSVTREGMVKAYRPHGQDYDSKDVPGECLIAPATKLRGLASADVLASLPREYEQHAWPKEFATPDEAKASLLATLDAMAA